MWYIGSANPNINILSIGIKWKNEKKLHNFCTRCNSIVCHNVYCVLFAYYFEIDEHEILSLESGFKRYCYLLSLRIPTGKKHKKIYYLIISLVFIKITPAKQIQIILESCAQASFRSFTPFCKPGHHWFQKWSTRN